ncbi:MAG: hypothetical protein WCG83_01910 [Candidatus Peregrinibacteria bacterium]
MLKKTSLHLWPLVHSTKVAVSCCGVGEKARGQKDKKARGSIFVALLPSCLLAFAVLLFALPGIRSRVFAEDAATTIARDPFLSPCSRNSDASKSLGFTVAAFFSWPTQYHDRVASIVEDHLQTIGKSAMCQAGNTEEFLSPGEKLAALARLLPTWKDGRSLSRIDIAPVLQEYLRIYECALKERQYYLALDAQKWTADQQARATLGDTSAEVQMTLGSLGLEMSKQNAVIERELLLARPLLNRTLTVIAGLDRLLPLDASLQCIERASLDIRNAAGLAAEAGSCFPRISNSKDPLRDLSL